MLTFQDFDNSPFNNGWLQRKATLFPDFERNPKIRPVSKFHGFHETKPNQNEVVRFFYNKVEFVLTSFAKFLFFSNRFSQHDRTVT